MSLIVFLMHLDLSVRIGYHLTTLHKNTTQTNPRCIIIYSVIRTTLRQGKHRGWNESVLELLEALFTSVRPFKLDFIHCQGGEWGGNGRKTLQKPAIVTNQSQEATYICGSKRFFGQFLTASIFLVSTSTHLLDTTWPRKVTDLSQKSHSPNLAYNWCCLSA